MASWCDFGVAVTCPAECKLPKLHLVKSRALCASHTCFPFYACFLRLACHPCATVYTDSLVRSWSPCLGPFWNSHIFEDQRNFWPVCCCKRIPSAPRKRSFPEHHQGWQMPQLHCNDFSPGSDLCPPEPSFKHVTKYIRHYKKQQMQTPSATLHTELLLRRLLH